MRKVLMAVVVLALFSGLYAFRLGLGVAYEDVLEDGRYLAVKADARVPLMPLIDIRACLLNVNLPEGGKGINFGTFTSTDLMLKVPMPAAFQPYLALGVWFSQGLEDAPMDYSTLSLKAALGGEMGFGGFSGYLEFGLNKFTWIKDGGTTKPMYAQLGVVVPIGL